MSATGPRVTSVDRIESDVATGVWVAGVGSHAVTAGSQLMAPYRTAIAADAIVATARHRTPDHTIAARFGARDTSENRELCDQRVSRYSCWALLKPSVRDRFEPLC